MKPKFISKVIFAIAALVSVSSCDDFLTQDNPNSVATSEYFTTVDRCEAALTGVYNAFKNQNIYAVLSDNQRSDLVIEGGSSANRETFTSEAYLHSYTDTYSTASNRWAALYTGIRRCNDLFAGIDVVRPLIYSESSLERLNEIEAQALFMRGLFYFFLTLTYRHDMTADTCAPLILESIESVEDLARPLATASAIRYQYRKDLLNAIDLGLPEEWTDAEDIGRVTSGAAYSILGMSYLYQATEAYNTGGSTSPASDYVLYVDDEGTEQFYPELQPADCYLQARTYFKKVIDSGYYELAEFESTDPEKVHNFTTEGEFNCESILEVSYTLTDNTNLSGEALLYNTYSRSFAKVGGYYSGIPSFWLVDEFQKEMPDEHLDENWIKLERDEFYGTLNNSGKEIKDVLYTQMGIARINEPYSLSTNPSYLVSDAIVHYCDGSSNGEDTYNSNIYMRSIIYRNDVEPGGDDRVMSVTYTSLFPYGSRRIVRNATVEPIVENETYFKSKLVGDDIYRIRKFTRRASYSMAINGDDDLYYYGEKTPQQQGSFTTAATGIFRKHTNWDIRTSESDATITTSSGINYRLIRLADVYLMYAEALIEGGNSEAGVTEALKYVNRVRRRAGAILVGSKSQSTEYSDSEATFDGDIERVEPTDDTTGCAGPYYQSSTGNMSAYDLMQHLMWVERPLELCLEGYMLRVCDLRRWIDPTYGTYNATGQRFKALAESYDHTYYFYNPKYLTVNATTGAFSTAYTYNYQERYSLFEDSHMTEGEVLYRDYAEANSVYGTWDWYFPIPSSEKVTNPYIK